MLPRLTLDDDGKIGDDTWPKLLNFKAVKPPGPKPEPKPAPKGRVCGPDVTGAIQRVAERGEPGGGSDEL